MKVVAPQVFTEFMAALNTHARQTVRLLKEKEITLTAQAQELLDSFEESETLFLRRELTREGKGGDAHRKIPTQTELRDFG